MKSKLTILTSYWFLIGLFLLLLNDFILKDLYGNWFTGKLSDFAGIFIFFLFWTAIFPKFEKTIFVLIGIFFVFWKSSYSQFLIDDWNALNLMRISRVVDYTDLLALLILPLAFRVRRQEVPVKRLRFSPVLPLAVASFAFIATSKEPQTCFDENEVVYFIEYSSRDSLISDLEKSNLNITISKPQSKSDYVFAKVPNLKDSIFDLELMIGEYDQSHGAVPISIRCWHYSAHRDNYSEKELSDQRKFVRATVDKEVFEPVFYQK